jgi:regulator of replication initiation timing
MKSKIVKGKKKEVETMASLKQEITRLHKKELSQENKILKLENKALKLEQKFLNSQMKNRPTSKSNVTHPFEVTLKGLNDKHDIIYSSKK